MDILKKISVITPTFNRANTLTRVFNSLKSQSYKDFEWIVMDDGSTDNTRELIEELKKESPFTIQYHFHENQNKFLTLLKSLDFVKGEYIAAVDSDDEVLPDAFEKLVKYTEQIKTEDNIVGVVGLVQMQDGTLAGKKFVTSPLDCTIFDMRYKYKVSGDKFGLMRTSAYKKIKIDVTKYKGKGFIPETVIFYHFDLIGKHRFVNEVGLIYHQHTTQEQSLSKKIYDQNNAYGLSESYLTFLNTYSKNIYLYPLPVIRNTIGYIFYSYITGKKTGNIFRDLKNTTAKVLTAVMLPLGYLYYLIKK